MPRINPRWLPAILRGKRGGLGWRICTSKHLAAAARLAGFGASFALVFTVVAMALFQTQVLMQGCLQLAVWKIRREPPRPIPFRLHKNKLESKPPAPD